MQNADDCNAQHSKEKVGIFLKYENKDNTRVTDQVSSKQTRHRIFNALH
jgi:hypothetical protein